MKVQPPVKPGWLFHNRRQYLAASEVPQTLNLPAHQISDAIAQGKLCIGRVSGCKVVELAKMMYFIDLREGMI